MLIYVEYKAKNVPLTQQLLQQFSWCEVIRIQHYKNLFDKTLGDYPTQPCLILANQDPIAILPTPDHYGFPGKSFFFKPSLNCVFDCSYCYLKGSFKNRFPVIFVNYEQMQIAIGQQIKKLRTTGYNEQITFYASNYADLLAIEQRTHFHESFLPFFQQYENVVLETRTKSANIETLTQLAQHSTIGSSNTEIAFSLSPSPIAKRYELGTASLEQKLNAINKLLQLNYRVGLRFLPLLPIENYETVYEEMLNQIKNSINLQRISSIFIAPLLYNAGDFAVIKKKKPDFPFRETLQARENGLMKMEEQHYERFFQLFQQAFPEKEILWDYK